MGRDNSRGRTPEGDPNPIDAYVGARMRMRRTLLGLSQEKLGEMIGMSFQQVQKYECGANRIGGSRLFDLSRALDVPVSYFFDEMDESIESASPAVMAQGGWQPAPLTVIDDSPMTKRETLELVRAYYAIQDPNVRRIVYELAKNLATEACSK